MRKTLARATIGVILAVGAMASTSQSASADQTAGLWPYRVTAYTGIYEDRGFTFNPGVLNRLAVGDVILIRPGTATNQFAEIEYVRRSGEYVRVTEGWWDTDFVRSSMIEPNVGPGWRWGTG